MPDYVQWRNKNEYRSYPMADNSSFTTQLGDRIPEEIFVDALITPIDPVGTVYVSSIDFTSNSLEVSDSEGVIATASLQAGEYELTLTDSYGRNLGVIIVSPTFYELGGSLQFRSHALSFAPAAVVPQSQNCVRAFRLPNGEIVTGDVVFVGIDGVEVTYDESNETIRIDVVGVNDEPECVDLPPPVKCVSVEQTGVDGIFAVSVDNDTIILETAYQLDDLCEEKKLMVLPDAQGEVRERRDPPCEDEDVTTCDGPLPVDPALICTNSLRIVHLSTLIGMEARKEPGIPAYEGDGLNALPERSKHVLKMYVRGLNA